MHARLLVHYKGFPEEFGEIYSSVHNYQSHTASRAKSQQKVRLSKWGEKFNCSNYAHFILSLDSSPFNKSHT